MKKSKKKLSASQIIRKRRQAIETKKEYMSILLKAVLIVTILFLVFTKLFIIIQVNGNTMFPAIKDGDLILAYRLQTDYSKNDVVVYDSDEGQKTGRIMALENDVVTIDDSGLLTVNGTVQEGEILFATYPGEALEYPYRVPEGCCFILSDNRSTMDDSRQSGAVPMSSVKGKVISVLRRRGI